ncbi:transposase [Bradyrhizobium sp. LB7.2]
MSQKLDTSPAVIGIDIGKNSFHIIGQNQRGGIVLRQKWSRGQVETRLANLPPCLIGMEACVGAHHLSRKLQMLGHDARLMPAKYVRPYSKGQKNDFRDAEAIAEAVQRPTMKFVATKTADQLDLQALHRVRERLVGQRTGVINQIRAFLLERGIALRQGLRSLRSELPGILATRTDVLSPRMLRIIEDLAGDWRRLDERIEDLSSEIEALARQDKGCERLMTVPGIGPIISSAMVAAIGTGDVFSKRPRLRRLAWTGAEADIDRRPHDPRQDIKARQSLPARAVCAGRVGCAGQGQGLGALWPQILDRSRQETIAPQRAGDCARQQARPHRLGGSQQGARLRVRQDR